MCHIITCFFFLASTLTYTGNYISCMTKSHCRCVCGGVGEELFWNFKCSQGILYVFLWTETGLAFLDRSRTEMGTPTQRLQVKKGN